MNLSSLNAQLCLHLQVCCRMFTKSSSMVVFLLITGLDVGGEKEHTAGAFSC